MAGTSNYVHLDSEFILVDAWSKEALGGGASNEHASDPHEVAVASDEHAVEGTDSVHGETSDVHASNGGHEGEEHAAHPPEVPNIITLAEVTVFKNVSKPVHTIIKTFEGPFFSFIAVLFLLVIVKLAFKRRSLIPGPLQNLVEVTIDGLYKFFESVMGTENIKRHFPFVCALFLFILFNNMMGLIPFLKPSTSMMQTTFTLSIITFFYVQITALRFNGVKGTLYHLAGEPEGKIMWAMSPLFFVLHIIGEFAKPLSLALRLYGNVLGKDILIGVFVTLGLMVVYPILGQYTWVGLPLQLPFFFLGLLLGLIQAVVFSLLAAIYIILVLPHEHEEH